MFVSHTKIIGVLYFKSVTSSYDLESLGGICFYTLRVLRQAFPICRDGALKNSPAKTLKDKEDWRRQSTNADCTTLYIAIDQGIIATGINCID